MSVELERGLSGCKSSYKCTVNYSAPIRTSPTCGGPFWDVPSVETLLRLAAIAHCDLSLLLDPT